MTVASFCTPNGDWPAHGERLRGECIALGVPYMIETLPDAGGWLANCRQKPVYLLGLRYRVRGPLLWVDVDSSLLTVPAHPRTDFVGRRKPPRDARAWHVDVMLFGDTPAALDLLIKWVGALGDHSDEHAFHKAWQAGWLGTWDVLPDGLVRHGRSKSARKRADLRRVRGMY